MRKLTLPALALLVVLGLSACAPDTGQAENNCMTASTGFSKENPPTTQNGLDRLFLAAETCKAEADKDPAAFNERWSNWTPPE